VLLAIRSRSTAVLPALDHRVFDQPVDDAGDRGERYPEDGGQALGGDASAAGHDDAEHLQLPDGERHGQQAGDRRVQSHVIDLGLEPVDPADEIVPFFGDDVVGRGCCGGSGHGGFIRSGKTLNWISRYLASG
jgi:hypothetical protein